MKSCVPAPMREELESLDFASIARRPIPVISKDQPYCLIHGERWWWFILIRAHGDTQSAAAEWGATPSCIDYPRMGYAPSHSWPMNDSNARARELEHLLKDLLTQ